MQMRITGLLLAAFACCACPVFAQQASEPTIVWTEVPTVDMEDPTLQRGIVYGPDGEPLAGAKIFAASTIELFEIRDAVNVSKADLGDVRAVTDDKGRFEFQTPDLTWSPAPGQRKRWEALLVAIKDGLAPGWIRTFGHDRGLRSHWHPKSTKKVAIHLRKPASLRGRFTDTDGNPVAGANVTLRQLMIPREYDLTTHIEKEELKRPGLFSSISYQDQFYRASLMPNLRTETKTDKDGWFSLDGLPEDYIASIKIVHPEFRTTEFRAAVHDAKTLYTKPIPEGRNLSLAGSGFTFPLQRGIKLSGHVRIASLTSNKAVAGATVAMANHNAKFGWSGQSFKTDDEGRFQLTGLSKRGREYTVAVVGSYDAPVVSKRFDVFEGTEATLEVDQAVPYELKLTDSDGKPVDREVVSTVVQSEPGTVLHGASSVFNFAERIAPGVYRGILPAGPGAVMVKRGSRRDRPVMVDPKAFFEPGRNDWTLTEQRHAYGDQWRIARPSVIRHPRLSAGTNWSESQLNLAAVVLVRAKLDEGPLQLAASIQQDDPPNVELVDSSGNPVNDVKVTRQLKRYDAQKMPSKFPLYGLHPDRAEFIQFDQEDRGLIGFVRATLTDQTIRVEMKPAAKLIGRFVGKDGKPTKYFGMVFQGAVPPETFIGNRTWSKKSGRGKFETQIPPGVQYSGKVARKPHHWTTRPNLGPAFEPFTPKPGETVDLGDIVVP